MNTAHNLLSTLFLLLILASYLIVWLVARNIGRSKVQTDPVDVEGLRAPGQSSIIKIDELSGKIRCCLAQVLIIPLILLSGYVSHMYLFIDARDSVAGWFVGGVGVAIVIYNLFKSLKLIRRRRKLKLGYQSELTVGHALNQLIRDGKYVYHDFPADSFNIDHIVVGPAGIFTVDSIARSKPARAGARREASIVEYNGKMLNFPKEDNFNIIEQAEWQASWLSDWISGAIGEQVAARAIVALPGWFVKRTSADGISVVNPDQFPSLFKHIKPRPLSEDTITRIVEQLRKKCQMAATVSDGEDRGKPAL